MVGRADERRSQWRCRWRPTRFAVVAMAAAAALQSAGSADRHCMSAQPTDWPCMSAQPTDWPCMSAQPTGRHYPSAQPTSRERGSGNSGDAISCSSGRSGTSSVGRTDRPADRHLCTVLCDGRRNRRGPLPRRSNALEIEEPRRLGRPPSRPTARPSSSQGTLIRDMWPSSTRRRLTGGRRSRPPSSPWRGEASRTGRALSTPGS